MIKVDGRQICIKKFPDGSLNLLQFPTIVKPIPQVEWFFDSVEEQVVLQNIVCHLRELGRNDIDLFMPYVPNARMDRTKSDNEIFTLKYFCRFINSLNFRRVFVADVHSPVTMALLDRAFDTGPAWAISALEAAKPDIIFFPDAGAQKRYIDYFKGMEYAVGDKVRDWKTGKIEGLTINVPNGISLADKHVLIVDDICSYGGTFKAAIQALDKFYVKDVSLYITHCEPNIVKGTLLDELLLTRVYTTDYLPRVNHPKITYMTNYREEN